MNKMTKFLIISLIILIFIIGTVLVFNSATKPPSPSPSVQPSPRPSSLGTIPNPSISPLPAPTSSAEIAKYQSETDRIYAEQLQKQDERYPWLEQMPLQTNNYFVAFDPSTDTFLAEIYNKSQKQQLQQEILQRLKSLNIDVAKYKIVWE